MKCFHYYRGIVAILLPISLFCGCIPTTQPNAQAPLQSMQQQDSHASSAPPLQTSLDPEEQEQFRLGYAKLLINDGKDVEAETILDKLRHSAAIAPEVYPLLAKIYERRDMHIEALIAWRKALRLREGDPELMGRVARAALVCKKYSEADEIFNQWIARNQVGSTLYISGLNNLGFSSLLQQKYDQAFRFLTQAITLDPLNKRAKANLALLERVREKRPEATDPSLAPDTRLLPEDQAPLHNHEELIP